VISNALVASFLNSMVLPYMMVFKYDKWSYNANMTVATLAWVKP
jgi:hypothetical protein